MNNLNDISDEDFVSFLHSLGVETYKKSFEWMLHDSDFADVLKWLYVNLDHNNALSAREECRYAEIEKRKCLLTPDELESSISTIQEQFEGICLPGDNDSMEDGKLDINIQKERLAMLQKHETLLQDLIKKNHTIKEELDIETTKLSASQRQCSEDETALGEQCVLLAEEVDNIVENVCDVICDNLSLCGSSSRDKEIANMFFAFGPFEAYKQSQSLFVSHFDLYVSKRFGNKTSIISDQDLRMSLMEAKNMEERLSDAVYAYISAKAELNGEQAKLGLVTNYNNVHPSQVTSCLLEAQNAVEILDQEESILDQQLEAAVKNFVSSRTNLALETGARSALIIREEIHKDLTFLLDTTQQALALDKLLYFALRNELRSLEELLHFASHLRTFVMGENEAVCSRIESMNEICAEHTIAEQRLQSTNIFHNILCSIFGVKSVDPAMLVRLHCELKNYIRDLNDNVTDGFKKKENTIAAFKHSHKPLREYIWDGCTKQPNCSDVGVASMRHQLKREMDAVDAQLLDASTKFTAVKNGDKQNLRKIWQWFLVDQAKLLSTMKAVQSKSFV